jgi:hypothetical protein
MIFIDMENIVEKTRLYQQFLEVREHIIKNKWYLSEKAGFDVGFERAVVDWTLRHRKEWATKNKSRY